MSDRTLGWFCFLLILLVLGDIGYRFMSTSSTPADPAIARMKALGQAVEDFDYYSFGSGSANAAAPWSQIKDETNRMEFIKYRADTMLAFAMAYRKTLFESQTNRVERPQDLAAVMTDISGLREEVRRLRRESSTAVILESSVTNFMNTLGTNSRMSSTYAVAATNGFIGAK